ncbi:mechanosensitive ion channel family protein [Halobium salinum]|uniref:Mechanosensitive ion channel family protein n=1 Tax=Halobium salinum TaxID=1364940 RepID=A0ABD5PF51_9EURY|nr:mechanosensitive ion channel family protein [Halobium salinum]
MTLGSALGGVAQAGQASDPVRAFLRQYLAREFVPFVQVALGVLTLLAFYYLSTYLVRLLGRPIARRFQRQSVAQTVLRGIRLGTLVLGSVATGAILGLGFPDIVLSVTVFSAVLGLVLAPIIGSLIGGLFVLADQPYEVGDMVELDSGQRGFVEDITLRYTKLITLDNTFLVIPNSDIRERDVINYSAEDTRTRLRLSILVTYESDIPQARDVIESAAGGVDDVVEGGPDIRIGAARYPAKPTCYIDEYGDHGVLLTLRYWAKTPYKLLTVRSKVQTRLWGRLHEPDVDVEIPYPHQHLVFDETSGEAAVAVRDGERRAAEPTADEPPSASRVDGDGNGVGDGRDPDHGDGTGLDGAEGAGDDR